MIAVIEAIGAQAVAGLLIFDSYVAVRVLGGVARLKKVSSRSGNAASSMAVALRLSLLRGPAFLTSQDLHRIILHTSIVGAKTEFCVLAS